MKNINVEKLKFSELLLNQINLIVIACDIKGNINYVSAATEKITGYSLENLTGKNWWNSTFFSKEDGLSYKEKVNSVISGKTNISTKPYERKLKCKDGSYKWIEWRDSLAEDSTYVSVGVDISDWKKTEEIKIQSDTIINSVDSMIFVSDRNGNVIFATPSVEKMLGYTVEEILGDNWWKVTYDDPNLALKIKKAINNYVFLHTKDFTDISKRKIRTKSGDFKWIEWQLSKGVNDTYISIGTDITNRVTEQGELKKAKETAEKSLKVKDEFLANMSHEIRTPLNAVIGFTDLLLETKLSVEQRQHLETMKNSGEILNSLINNVLDLAKLDSNKLNIENISFNLHKNIYEIVKLMKIRADEKNIALNLIINPNIPVQVFGDPTRFSQILLNLIGNAIKFTNKGSVTVTIKLIEESSENAKIHFEVLDTGIGIVSNKINTVFGAFTQAKSDTSRIYGGTGLGLAIVKKLVKLLNGDINVKSKFGKGSVFNLNLSFKKDHIITASTEINKNTIKGEKLDLKILLVEDNKTNQILAKTRLERWGCTIAIANNGIEGVKKVQYNMYDLILMDIQMPVMDGYEATKIIKNDLSEETSKIPIIAMTAYTSKSDIQRALDVGMNDYIFKPFKTNDLFSILLKYGGVKNNTTENDYQIVEEKKEILDNETFTDLSYLKEESLNESEILKLLIEQFLKDLNDFLIVLDLGLEEKNWDLLHGATHKIKPSVSMFGISKLNPIIQDLTDRFRHKEKLDDIDDLVTSCREILNSVKVELQTELKTIINE
ncbi:PAS/PAC sensor hybrid histidine kinase [Lutibacter agarilyticus]|uniref:histidine kinase n=1 Tax=Lutibacter agarilyticus TaxID=1109740 RepID=A0A238VHY0_9FLAO|nr:PAS domain S-box protein [Lutibacter agarilyticus]SNR34000.1 PAS/PAC sensor hybrid histidine kinase [Lutibacter agarilyticus]